MLCLVLLSSVAEATSLFDGHRVIQSVEQRLFLGEQEEFAFGDTISTGYNTFEVVDGYTGTAPGDDTTLYVVVICAIARDKQCSDELAIVYDDFLLLDQGTKLYYAPALYWLDDPAASGMMPVGFPYRLRPETEYLAFEYQIPAYDKTKTVDFAWLHTNLLNDEPAGPVYTYSFSAAEEN